MGTSTRPLTIQPRPAFLALEDLPPLAGVKLVRPRRYAAAGAPACPLAARQEIRAAARKDPEEQSAQPGGARSHRASFVRPLDTGGPYGCRGQGRASQDWRETCPCPGGSPGRCVLG